MLTEKVFLKAGLIRDNNEKVKLLANGDVVKAFTVSLDKISETAKKKIKEAGGKFSDEEDTSRNEDSTKSSS